MEAKKARMETEVKPAREWIHQRYNLRSNHHVSAKDNSDWALTGRIQLILPDIFKYLEHNELGRAAQVCKTWEEATRTHEFRRKVIYNQFYQQYMFRALDHASGYCKYFRHLTLFLHNSNSSFIELLKILAENCTGLLFLYVHGYNLGVDIVEPLACFLENQKALETLTLNISFSANLSELKTIISNIVSKINRGSLRKLEYGFVNSRSQCSLAKFRAVSNFHFEELKSFCNLVSLSIRYPYFNQEQVTSIVRANSRTLRKLILRNCLFECSSWSKAEFSRRLRQEYKDLEVCDV